MKRVEKELAHIREQFSEKSITGYNMKKYIWKLVYIYMLGYDVDFGHMVALKLIACTSFSEKNAGYMACSLLLNETHELLRLIIQVIKKDLLPGNEYFQSLALSCIANVGGQEFAESLATDVQRVLVHGKTPWNVRKKAALALLRLFRKSPESVPQESDFRSMTIALLEDEDLGIAVSVASLLLGIVSHHTTGYEELPAKAIFVLARLAFSKDRTSPYKYYLTISPWLQVKLLRILQYFPPPTDKQQLDRLKPILIHYLTHTQMTKNANKNNGDHAILFEAINLITHLYLNGFDGAGTDLHGQAAALLGRFVSIREPNYRYLGLETMARMARVPQMLETIKRHEKTVSFSLKDPDISIRKRALNLLYVMCDSSNARDIVGELLNLLQTGSYDLKEELVLQIAILAEKFAVDLRWYLDCILQLISTAGEFVTDDIWYRVVQIVTNHHELQDYAATTCYNFLKSPTVPENGIKVAAYILGEFSHEIKDVNITPEMLFEVMMDKFKTSSSATKALILSSFVKMASGYPMLKERINAVFMAHRSTLDTEIQQRACEYLAFNLSRDEALVSAVLEPMPNFSERESVLEKRIKKTTHVTTDRDVFADADAKSKALLVEGGEPAAAAVGEEEGKKKKGGKKKKDDDSDDEKEREDDERTRDLLSEVLGDQFPSQSLDRFSGLLANETGIVYDSPALQVAQKVIIDTPGEVKLALAFQNKSSQPILQIATSPMPQEGISFQLKTTEAFTVGPASQAVQYYKVLATAPFFEYPALRLSFLHDNRRQNLTLRLPISAGHFARPTPMASADFVNLWKSNTAEVQKVCQTLEPVTVEQVEKALTASLRFSMITGVARLATNVTAAGTVSIKSGSGDALALPVLVGVETKPDANIFRVTVHAGNPTLSEAVATAVQLAMHAKPMQAK